MKRLDMLVKALSEMSAPLGYGVAVCDDCRSLALYRLSDPRKICVSLLCAVVGYGKTDHCASAEALLGQYESSASHTAFFYDRYGGVEFPGGSPEEIELKAAAGLTVRPAKGQLW